MVLFNKKNNIILLFLFLSLKTIITTPHEKSKKNIWYRIKKIKKIKNNRKSINYRKIIPLLKLIHRIKIITINKINRNFKETIEQKQKDNYALLSSIVSEDNQVSQRQIIQQQSEITPFSLIHIDDLPDINDKRILTKNILFIKRKIEDVEDYCRKFEIHYNTIIINTQRHKYKNLEEYQNAVNYFIERTDSAIAYSKDICDYLTKSITKHNENQNNGTSRTCTIEK